MKLNMVIALIYLGFFIGGLGIVLILDQNIGCSKMGISPFDRSRSSFSEKSISRSIGGISSSSVESVYGHNSSSSLDKFHNLPNPKPDNYTIMDYVQIGNALVIKIKYHDCTNYEGVKILVYKNTTINDLRKQKYIDPHFCENKKFHSPIARFEPTDNGWNDALDYASTIGKG